MDLSAQPAASPAPHSYINRQQAFPAKNYATTNKKKKKICGNTGKLQQRRNSVIYNSVICRGKALRLVWQYCGRSSLQDHARAV